MPFESEAWLVRLIVVIVVIVIIIVVVVATPYFAPASAPVDAAVEVPAAYANARDAIGAGVVRTIRKMSVPNLGETSIPDILNMGETSSISDSSSTLNGVLWSESSFFYD